MKISLKNKLSHRRKEDDAKLRRRNDNMARIEKLVPYVVRLGITSTRNGKSRAANVGLRRSLADSLA